MRSKEKISLNRLNNLKELSATYGRQKLADKVNKSYSLITGYLSGHKKIGEQSARDIEDELEIEPLWLDQDHSKENLNHDKKHDIIFRLNNNFDIPIYNIDSISSIHNFEIPIMEIKLMITEQEKMEIEARGVDFSRCFYWVVHDDSMADTLESGTHVLIEKFRGEIKHNRLYLFKLKDSGITEIRRVYKKSGKYVISCDNTVRREKNFPDEEFSEIPDEMYLGRVISWTNLQDF